MKKILINGAKVIGIKLAMSFIGICLMFCFTWLFSLPGGFTIYSVILTAFMCRWIFTEATAFGRKKYSEKFPAYYGLICGFISEIPSLILLFLMYVIKPIFMKLNLIFCAYNGVYVGMIVPNGKIFYMESVNPISFLLILILPALYFIGFALGKRGYEPRGNLMYKLVYKGGDKKDEK